MSNREEGGKMSDRENEKGKGHVAWVLFHSFLKQLLSFVVEAHRAERVGPVAEAGKRAVRILETNGGSGGCVTCCCWRLDGGA